MDYIVSDKSNFFKLRTIIKRSVNELRHREQKIKLTKRIHESNKHFIQDTAPKTMHFQEGRTTF